MAVLRIRNVGEEYQNFARRFFYPYMNRRAEAMKEYRRKFVHYTSAEAAQSIIKSNRFWMRNASTMNDFSEVEYGLGCLAHAYNDTDYGKRFRALVEAIWPGFSEEFQRIFNGWGTAFKQGTYLACFSEHVGGLEDMYGRLSMWRAYGGANGVALVLNPDVFFSRTRALSAYSSPVMYATQEEFDNFFEEFVTGLETQQGTIPGMFEKEDFLGDVFEVFRFAVMSTKHPGFAEEQEWRVIHSPQIHPSPRRLERSVEVVRALPQVVYKIPLVDVPDEGLVGLELPIFLDKVIIGPTKHPNVMAEAFVQLLAEVGINNPRERVVVSEIPLRTE